MAVFSGEGMVLLQRVTDIQVSLLTRTDRKKLSQGIRAQNDRELAMLLEDLGS